MKIILISFLYIITLNASAYQALLFNGNCITCHFENKTVSAPSVQNFKRAYISAFPNKEDFINYMSTWVQHPNAQTTLMHDAIKKHELMPELGFDLDTLRQISEYIYYTDFSKSHKEHK